MFSTLSKITSRIPRFLVHTFAGLAALPRAEYARAQAGGSPAGELP